MSEFESQPGKRVKPKITDLLDDEMPEEREQQVMQAIRQKAYGMMMMIRISIVSCALCCGQR
jgi:hypothetical protein